MNLGARQSAPQEIGKLFESDTLLPERYYAALRKATMAIPSGV